MAERLLYANARAMRRLSARLKVERLRATFMPTVPKIHANRGKLFTAAENFVYKWDYAYIVHN